jgi:hypothetical protein
MSKNIAEQSNALSIFWLKKQGYLQKDFSHNSGGIKWSWGGEEKSSISFYIHKDNWGTPQERAYIGLQYTQTNYSTGEKERMDYNVELDTTPCKYGGKRYWFICPLSKNGEYCGRRVGVLYNIGKWFGCRHCGDIAYAKQMEGGRYRWDGVSAPNVDKAQEEVKRMYYRGKPTRKYKRYLRLNDKFEMGWITMASRLDKRFGRFNPNKK